MPAANPESKGVAVIAGRGTFRAAVADSAGNGIRDMLRQGATSGIVTAATRDGGMAGAVAVFAGMRTFIVLLNVWIAMQDDMPEVAAVNCRYKGSGVKLMRSYPGAGAVESP